MLPGVISRIKIGSLKPVSNKRQRKIESDTDSDYGCLESQTDNDEDSIESDEDLEYQVQKYGNSEGSAGSDCLSGKQAIYEHFEHSEADSDIILLSGKEAIAALPPTEQVRVRLCDIVSVLLLGRE